MARRSGDWLHQAGRDLDQALDSAAAGRHERACFAAHQSAEKARYPTGHPDGAPGDHYGALQSGEAIEHARAILGFVRSSMA